MQIRSSLFVLGDSISIHYGPYLERMLAGRFYCDRKGSKLLEATDPGRDHGGHDILRRLAALDSQITLLNGGDSSCVLAYLQAKTINHRLGYTVLLLNCGLHDLRVVHKPGDPNTGKHQVEPDDYAGNLEKIARLARTASRWVVWVRTTPVADDHHNRISPGFLRFNSDVMAYNAIADEKMKKAGIPSIDLYNFTLSLCDEPGRLEDLLCDHVHFNEAARRSQGAYIAGWLDAYLACEQAADEIAYG